MVPDPKPEGRPYVVDRIPQVIHPHPRYGAGLASLEGECVTVEWDVAVDPELMDRFEAHVALRPDQPLVSPVRLWAAWAPTHRWPQPPWSLRKKIASGANPWADEDWVDTGDPFCDFLCTNLIYWPAAFLEGAKAAGLADWDYPTTDTRLANWAITAGYAPVRIAWDAVPMHVHFDMLASA